MKSDCVQVKEQLNNNYNNPNLIVPIITVSKLVVILMLV
jgi:hypothetical protein